MKKYEYRVVHFDRLMRLEKISKIEVSLEVNTAPPVEVKEFIPKYPENVSEEILFQAVLDNLGKDGWDLIMVRGDVIGKREIS